MKLHDQLPLAVPCYDLLPVTELRLTPPKRSFIYSRLPWVDGRFWNQSEITLCIVSHHWASSFPAP